LRRRSGTALVGMLGWSVFALTAIGCAVAKDLTLLLVLRAVQATGAAAGLVTAFAVLREPGEGGRGPGRLWTAASVFGTAAGPALGGVLTEALDWRAIFFVQVPFGVVAVIEARAAGEPAPAREPVAAAEPRAAGALAAPAVAIALLSAALTGVLFLLVLMLVSGWSLSPAVAALAVSILPIAAIGGARLRGEPRAMAAAGCALVGAGVLALAWVPTASVAWTVPSQVLAGLGMGMAFNALAGPLLPERTPGQAAALLSVRHAGITLALLLLAPITAAKLDDTVSNARERTAAVILDARLPPLDKLALVGPISSNLDPVDPRAQLTGSLDKQRGRYADDPVKSAEYDDLVDHVDGTIIHAVGDAFRIAFVVAGALALLGALVLLPGASTRAWRAAALAAVALALPVTFALIQPGLAPAQGQVRDPCKPRQLPHTGGITGMVQDVGLVALDRAACKYGSSREELAIALADPGSAKRFEQRHGVNPRSASGLLQTIMGNNPGSSALDLLRSALGG
ncbi:MAG: hypothetical protein QOJ07_788, partial [Thermoleophilaceae bacterium]|nr:hypothetical protein [Thermoleophilaceae bacterium]